MNRDFAEMLSALSAAGADYLIVGAHALAVHGYPRATGDLDLWVRPTPENARRVWAALEAFQAPLAELSLEDLARPDLLFQIGVVPCRIDIVTGLTGVEFETAWENRIEREVEGQALPFIGRDDLMANKRATGRPRDVADLAWLESGES
jgi:hypothetical protein